MNAEINGQPSEIAIGPPLFQPGAKVVKQPAKIEMIENEIAKLEKLLQLRLSSCLYPSSAKRRSSSVLLGKISSYGSKREAALAHVILIDILIDIPRSSPLGPASKRVESGTSNFFLAIV